MGNRKTGKITRIVSTNNNTRIVKNGSNGKRST
jgi:hypothetical protein